MAISLTIPSILLISFSALAQNQKADSLLQVLPSLKEKARIDCLNEIGFEYSNQFWNSSHEVKLDVALKYINYALKESQETKYAEGIAIAYQNLGMVEEERGNYIKSEEYTQYAIDHLRNTKRQREYNRAIVNLGYCAMIRGRYRQAISILENVLHYYQALQDSVHTSMIYRMISRTYLCIGYSYLAFQYSQKNALITNTSGDVYGQVLSPELKGDLYLIAGDTVKAISYFRQSTETARLKMANAYYLNLANQFKLTGQYDSALYYVKENTRLIPQLTDDAASQVNLLMEDTITMVKLYLLLEDYEKVINYSKGALRFFIKTDEVNGIMDLLLTIAKAYEKKHDEQKVLYYINRMLGYAEKSEERTLMIEGYRVLWNTYQQLGQTTPAYKYLVKYSSLKDSADKDNYKAKIAAWDAITEIATAEKKYEQQLKITREKNNARVAAMRMEKQLQLKIFIAFIVICLLSAVFIIRGIRMKRKKDQLLLLVAETSAQLEKRKTEQEVAELQLQKTEFEMQALRAQMNPHFIFNCLSSINRYILTNNTESASEYLTKFSRLIRMSLQNSEKSMITLENELEMIRLYLELERLRFKNVFNYTISFINTIDTSAVFIPPMILQPFAENAIWHGLMHKEGRGQLDIAISVEQKILTCTITDDGIGRKKAALLKTKSVEKNKAMGIRINTERLSLLNRPGHQESTCIIEDLTDKEGKDCGTKVILKIKYKDLVEAYS